MKKHLTDLIFTLTATSLIFLGNKDLITINLFMFIIFSSLNMNYLSYVSIIPIFYLYPNEFLPLLILVTSILLILKTIKNSQLSPLAIYIISLGYLSYIYFVNRTSMELVLLLLIILSIVIIAKLLITNKGDDLLTEVLFLYLFVINISIISIYAILLIQFLVVLTISYKHPNNFYKITSFLITIYALYITDDYRYLLLQIIAYLGYLFKRLFSKKDDDNSIEYVIEDINNNVSIFCNLLSEFKDNNYQKDYEAKISTCIKILIESFCANCNNRIHCYGNDKMKTYIYLKESLLNKEINRIDSTNGFFTCIYYQDINKKAKELFNTYNLKEKPKNDLYKLEGVTASLQNYFIGLFERITPNMIHIHNFKTSLNNDGIEYRNYKENIMYEDYFELQIEYFNKNNKIQILKKLNHYFKDKDLLIEEKNNTLFIKPKMRFKITYDHATLSHNNMQLSGDNFLFKTNRDGSFIAALSDGMGSGYEAHKLSQETLKLIEQISLCNINFETSLQIINNLFKARDNLDTYSTLDFIDINLFTGKFNLYKLGSSTTFIVREKTIIPIYNTNLPFGINDLVTKEEFNLEKDDLIIMVTDGISDYISEKALSKYIETMRHESPHKIVYNILQKVYYENNKEIKDDMSCAAIKIE